jgi:NAD(P)-dependent dehydrogenase (short-subunit alcohol dehydrogenase family)
MSANERFEAGEVAWITGASSGIGFALASRLAAENVTVAMTARRLPELERAVAAIRSAGGAALAAPADVADPASLALAAQVIAKELGRCDIVAPFAGAEYLMPLAGMSAKRWEDVLKVHITGAFETVRSVLRLLELSGARAGMQGRVALLSSTAALKGWPGQSAYAAAKGGQIAGMRSLAAELAPKRIRVNAVAAGIVRTPLQQRLFARMPPEKQREIEQAHALGLGDAESVADAAAFLLSNESRWITGTCLNVDGGLAIS